MGKELQLAVAYLRTSSASNVGADKDSHTRQLTAIEGWAKRSGVKIRQPPFYDAAVSGADFIHQRQGFGEMLAYMAEHPEVTTILVETASRFARDLIVQETGYRMLKERGISLIAVDSPESFLDDNPTASLVRQILGAVAEFDKAMTVAKLKGARDRKRAATGRCEGRKPLKETHPDVVALARKLRHKNPKTKQVKGYGTISKELAAAGMVNSKGKPYQVTAVKRMLIG